jgi:hypothetical protein
MFIRLWLALSAFLLLASVALAAPKPSTPKECPVTEHSLDAIETAIEKAASCEQSMDIFQACAYGASGDVALGQAVIGKCEGDFLGKLNSGQKRAYEEEIKRCWRKYRREAGTMYRSFEAMCAAAVAQAYSRRLMRTGGAKQHKWLGHSVAGPVRLIPGNCSRRTDTIGAQISRVIGSSFLLRACSTKRRMASGRPAAGRPSFHDAYLIEQP